MRGKHEGRMYRTDKQGVCESLDYNAKDAGLTMLVDRIVWNYKQQ